MSLYCHIYQMQMWQCEEQEDVQLEVNHGGQQFEQVQSFKFLGSYKTATGDCSKDIKIRAALARQKATELTNIWKDRNISKVLKVRVMKQIVWAFLHGVEGWTIKKSDKNIELRPWKCGVGEKCWEFHGGNTGQTNLSLKNLMWKENS